MRADELLGEVESLPYRARCARLAAVHTHVEPADLARLLGELNGRGAYERSVGLFIAAAARDMASLAHIAAAVGDADADIAAAAIGLAVRLGAADAAVLGAFIGDAPAESRALLYRAIRRYRRTDLAEGLVGPVGDRWGDREAAVLLPACGAETVERLLPALAYAVLNWSTLGHAHPGPMLDHAERELADLPRQLRGAWWTSRGPGLAEAVRHEPLRVIGLLERHWDRPVLINALVPKLGVLIAAAPERMADLLLRPVIRPSLSWLLQARSVRERLVRLLPEPRLAELLKAVREDDAALVLMLRTFPPARRERVFDTALEGIDLSARELAPAVLDVLPLARRGREAGRMLGLRKVADDPWRALEVTAFLPAQGGGCQQRAERFGQHLLHRCQDGIGVVTVGPRCEHGDGGVEALRGGTDVTVLPFLVPRPREDAAGAGRPVVGDQPHCLFAGGDLSVCEDGFERRGKRARRSESGGPRGGVDGDVRVVAGGAAQQVAEHGLWARGPGGGGQRHPPDQGFLRA